MVDFVCWLLKFCSACCYFFSQICHLKPTTIRPTPTSKHKPMDSPSTSHPQIDTATHTVRAIYIRSLHQTNSPNNSQNISPTTHQLTQQATHATSDNSHASAHQTDQLQQLPTIRKINHNIQKPRFQGKVLTSAFCIFFNHF